MTKRPHVIMQEHEQVIGTRRKKGRRRSETCKEEDEPGCRCSYRESFTVFCTNRLDSLGEKCTRLGCGTIKEHNFSTLNEMGSNNLLSPSDEKGGRKGYNQGAQVTSSVSASSCSLSTSPLSTSPTWWLLLLVFSWNLSSTSSFCPPSCSCDDVALSVDCLSANNLRVVPIFLNPQIKFLSLSKNQIKDITMSLQFYSELLVLDISHNKLESLGKTNFENQQNLHLLNVSYNLIKTLEAGVFTGLTHMRVVDLSGNQLERLDKEVLWSLPHIKEVILDRNRLEFLDWDWFQGLDSLERISAKFNFIQVIEPSPSFSQQSLKNFGNSSSSWTLKHVHYLDMSSNQLTRVKDYGLLVFAALKELNLCSNYIHTLEEKAFLISNSTGVLERVNLSQNRLGRVPTEALDKLGSTLRQLDLSSNRISDHISKNAFRRLVQLESLQLSDNPEILYIDPDALSENINLINFEADYLSNVTEISPALLRNKLFLENFSLKYASISSLSPDFFLSPVSDVVGCIDLTGNPIDCNCSSHSFYQFVTERLEDSQTRGEYGLSAQTNGENGFRSIPNDDRVDGHSNSSSHPSNELSFNPILISHHVSAKRRNNKSNTRKNLLYVRCRSPTNLVGVLVKDLKPSDFQHCFTEDDQVEIMVICIGAGLLSIIFVTIAIKLCCLCGLFRRLSAFCKSHCTTANCCQLNSTKEKSSSDKLFFDSMTIALRRDLAPVAPPSNYNCNLQNEKSILGEHHTSQPQLLYCGNGSAIPLQTNGCIIRGSYEDLASKTLGRNSNHRQLALPMHYDDSYRDDDDDDDHDDGDSEGEQQPHKRPVQHRSQVYNRREQLEHSYAPIEPPPPIPVQFPNQTQSLSRKQQRKHHQMLLQKHQGHQHHSPTMGYSPKHYTHHHPHSSPKHSQQQQHNPPVIVHYEYPDFPSMHRVKPVPSVLV